MRISRSEMAIFEGVWQDVRYAARSLRRSRAFTAAAVVTLALGIGATTAVFTVVSAVLLRPLPYREPDRLVMVWQEYINRGWGIVGVSHANLAAIARQSRTLEAVGGFQPTTISLSNGGDPQRVDGARVTSSIFEMLGVAPAAGRLFNSDDERAGAERVALISDALWRRMFGADPSAVGGAIDINGDRHRVVGVMAPGSEFPPRFRMTLASAPVTMPAMDVWMPLVLNPDPGRVGFRDTLAIARLAPGATVEAARGEAPAMAAALLREFPGPANTGLTLAIVPLAEQTVGDVRQPLLLLFAAVALVVLIACANVASMLLARAASRRSEDAIRAALGASPGRLRRYAIAECLLLAAASATLGLALAVAVTEIMATSIAARLPQFQGVALDLRLAGFAALLATAVAVVFGCAPAMYAASSARGRLLTGSAKGLAASPTTAMMRRTLLACEAALAIFLLVGAGLLARSFQALISVDPGFDPAGKLAVGLTLPAIVAPSPDDRRAMYDRLVARIRAVPGVERLGVSSSLPLTGDIGTGGLTIAGRDIPASAERPHAAQRRVDPGYFDVMGMRLARGRAFTADDRPGAPAVAIINETAARQFWPGADPIGQRIRPDGFGDDFWLTVVGVVRDVRYAALNAAPDAEVYWPYALTPGPTLVMVLRSDVPPAALEATLRTEARALDSRLPALWVGALDDLVAESLAESRLLVALLGVFALFGLAVSASGIYGVASYMVAQRRQDVAVRLALGASPRRVILVVLAEAVVPVMAGVGLGLAGAVAVSPAIADRLFEVSPHDPAALAVGPVILLAAAVAACYGPARRALGINPVAALRIDQ